jgi:hypothetical protein
MGSATGGRRRAEFRPAEIAGLEPRLVLSGAGHAVQALHAPPLVAHAAVGLTPPWYTLRSEMAATVGKTPGVAVGPLMPEAGGNYSLTVTVRNSSRASMLASVLAATHDYGHVHVQVTVQDTHGHVMTPVTPASANQLASFERSALSGNPLLKKVLVHPLFEGSTPVVFPVFAKQVIQFTNDNLADSYHNYNATAAATFADVLADEAGGIGVSPSTAVR